MKIRPILNTFIIICSLLLLFKLGSAGASLIISGQEYRIKHSGTVTATAYNSLAGQTDSTPWTTAAGTRCREGVIASNFLPIGTKVAIEGFDNRIFIVEDRMHPRFSNRIDIWFRHYNDAVKFGKRKIKFKVIEPA